jgi:hypothetical protein
LFIMLYVGLISIFSMVWYSIDNTICWRLSISPLKGLRILIKDHLTIQAMGRGD